MRPDIKTPEAVKAKRIGVTGLGSSGHLALLLMLRKWNIAPEEIQVLQVGASPVMVISLQKRRSRRRSASRPEFFCRRRRRI